MTPRTNHAAVEDPTTRTSSLFLVVPVLACVHFLMAVCALAIPWRVLQLGGTAVHVGAAFSIAAAVEIPIIAFARRIAHRLGYGSLLSGCAIVMSVAFLTAATAGMLTGIYVVSLLNGVITGMMMGASLILLQEQLPDRPGHASAIYSNILRLTYITALLAPGVVAQHLSVVAIFWMAGLAACALSVVLLLLRLIDRILGLSACPKGQCDPLEG